MSETREVPSKNYFGREMLALKILGVSLYGNDSPAYKVYSIIVLAIFQIPYPIIASGDLFKYKFEVVAELLIYILGTAMGVGMAIVLYLNREKLGKLINKLESEPFSPNIDRGGETEAKLMDKWLSFYNKLRIVYYVAVAGSIGPPILVTLIKRIRSSDYRDWEFGFGPLTILNVTYSPNYEISWMYQNICILCIGYSISAITVLVVGILSFVCLQFRILQNYLRRIIDVARENYEKDASNKNEIRHTEIPWMYSQRVLKQAINFHMSILDIGAEIESTFSILILWLYFTALILLCFEIVRATQIPLNDPRSFGVLIESVSVVFEIFIVCFSGEQMAHQGLEVGRAAYETGFVGTDVRFQKELLIIIRRNQNTMRLRAGNFIETSMATFVSIMRTSYSAFTMLRNTNMKT